MVATQSATPDSDALVKAKNARFQAQNKQQVSQLKMLSETLHPGVAFVEKKMSSVRFSVIIPVLNFGTVKNAKFYDCTIFSSELECFCHTRVGYVHFQNVFVLFWIKENNLKFLLFVVILCHQLTGPAGLGVVFLPCGPEVKFVWYLCNTVFHYAFKMHLRATRVKLGSFQNEALVLTVHCRFCFV